MGFILNPVTPKLFKATDVCELARVQPYVLRSWEKEFPGIGVQKSADAPRLYRQSDVEQVLRIKQLVFGEGLTVAGARRRLEESAPVARASKASEVVEVLDTLGAHARTKIASVREGLRALHALLSKDVGEFELQPFSVEKAKKSAATTSLRVASRGKAAKPAKRVVVKKAAPAKRRRAHA